MIENDSSVKTRLDHEPSLDYVSEILIPAGRTDAQVDAQHLPLAGQVLVNEFMQWKNIFFSFIFASL